MNENLRDLIERTFGEDYLKYFDPDSSKIASAFGFEGDQADAFSKYFRPFKQDAFNLASQEIRDRQETRTGFLERDYQSGLTNLQSQYDTGFQGLNTQLEQATRQIANQQAQTGASFGATQRQMSESREMVGDTLADLMQRRQTGMDSMSLGRERSLYGIEQQAGQERAGLTRTLEDYINRLQSQAQRVDSLDITDNEDSNTNNGYTNIRGRDVRIPDARTFTRQQSQFNPQQAQDASQAIKDALQRMRASAGITG